MILLPFDALVFAVGLAAGAVASVAGFGVGSLLTPLLASQLGGKLAVAAVAIPHALGTFLRLWSWRHHVSREVLLRFGLPSAAGGLVGAYTFTRVTGEALLGLLATLLIFVGVLEVTRLARRLRLRGPLAWIAGAGSGMLGGMVGNQGGIRSAGLLTFDLPPKAFVATSAAIALVIDGVRLPFYLYSEGSRLLAETRVVAVASVAVVIGTFLGAALLTRLPADLFRPVVGAVLISLGLWMLA